MIKIKNPLKLINFAVLLQQQRYLLPISFLFYLYNGLTFSDFIFFQGVFYFTCLIFEIPAGYIGDIFPRKNILIFSYVLFLLRIILWLFFKGYWVILAGEILFGLSKSFYRGVSDGYIYDYLKLSNIPQKMLDKYGAFNCFMSFGSAISALVGVYLFKFLGFKILLSVELIINIFAIVLLFFLPQIPHSKIKSKTFLTHTKTIFISFRKTLNDKNINLYIFYSAILVGITSLFVWNFQPLMKLSGVPVIFFGVIYFFNHIVRAFCSLFANKIVKKISINCLSMVVWGVYFLSFVLLIFNQKILNSALCFISLCLVCLAIGIQMVFNVATVARMHEFIFSKVRATSSSVNSMMQGLCSGGFLMIYKSFLESEISQYAFLIFVVLFIFVLYFPLRLIKNRQK